MKFLIVNILRMITYFLALYQNLAIDIGKRLEVEKLKDLHTQIETIWLYILKSGDFDFFEVKYSPKLMSFNMILQE